MPRMDKAEYNAYMKEYMRKKRAKDKGLASLPSSASDPIEIAEAVPAKKPRKQLKREGTMPQERDPEDYKSIEYEDVQRGVEMAKAATRDKDTGEDDPMLKYIDRIVKLAPLAEKFIDGFSGAMKNFQAQQAQLQPMQQGPRPPDGWVQMSPIQRLSFKYKNPEWYAAGIAWENGGHAQSMQQSVSYVDPSYTRAQQQAALPEPRNLRELSAKYPEPPQLREDIPMAEPRQSTHHKSIDEIRASRQAEPAEPAGPAEPALQGDQVVQALRADNARYLKMAIDYLNALPMEKFQEHAKNIDGLVMMARTFKELLPIHLKDMILYTPDEELVTLFKSECKEKWTWLEQQGLDQKVVQTYKQLKEELKAGPAA